MRIREPGLRRSLAVAFACIGLAGLGLVAATQKQSADRPEYKEYDQPVFEAVKAKLLDRSADHRLSALDEMVKRNAKEAKEVLATVLDDRSSEIRRRVAEYLAMMGDERGLEFQARCLKAPECSDINHHAARLLGNSGDEKYAPLLREEIERLLQQGNRNGKWLLGSDDRALLKYATIGLARIGRVQDHELILKVIANRPHQDRDFLEALGYVNERRSFEILWSAYRSMLRKPTCSEGGLGVPALVPLGRLGDQRAIELLKDILRGIGTVETEWRGTYPSLCDDRAQAFQALKPRDATNFAETVFEVAAQDPEGPGSIEAWTALGLMRPVGYGERVFKLAMRKKPHWKLVTRDMLHDAILAIDPSLNDAFWKEYGVSPIPTYSGRKALVEMGLHRLMFPGTSVWTGD